ncbi:MAG: SDR family NAD(P)-dependent oxidoreductase [Atopobiaceae bacterium]|jgi:short-subunit dehydrogenase
MKIALITGASSGLGREYVRQALNDASLDEIWVVARRKQRLVELQQKYGDRIIPVTMDLSSGEDIRRLNDMLEDAAKKGPFEIGLLVNAAGLGKFGTYADIGLQEVDAMIDINCRALVEVTQIALHYMHAGGKILQIASSASFQPLPGLNVYAASKAFVRSYTRALRFELRGRKISVTAVCPIWIKTEFIDVARMTQNGQTVKHPQPLLSPEHVVHWSMMINKINYPIATCCVSGFIMRIAGKILPAPLLMWAWEGLRRI